VTTAPSIPYVIGSSTNATNDQTRKPTNELDQDAFLKLMVAQLRYQNPMSPADPQAFLAQTAQFTTVEKLTQLTQQLADSDLRCESAARRCLVTYQLKDGAALARRVRPPDRERCVIVVN
jgi:hypothetical protein